MTVIGGSPRQVVDKLDRDRLVPVDVDPDLGPVQGGLPVVGFLMANRRLFVGFEERHAPEHSDKSWLENRHLCVVCLRDSVELVQRRDKVVACSVEERLKLAVHEVPADQCSLNRQLVSQEGHRA
jgi:hypothetical protein